MNNKDMQKLSNDLTRIVETKKEFLNLLNQYNSYLQLRNQQAIREFKEAKEKYETMKQSTLYHIIYSYTLKTDIKLYIINDYIQ